MTTNPDADVDPRFDPVFQRGYDPAVHRSAVARSAARRPEPERTPSPSPAPPPAEPVAELAPDAEFESESEATEAAEAPRFNPFRLVLLLASIAALAGAALILWKKISSDPYYYGSISDNEALFRDALVTALLPSLTTGGMIGLALWLALGALRRRDRD
jgi:hypothetical protein